MANSIQVPKTTEEMPYWIVIRDETGGKGNEIITHTMNAGEVLQVWAAGYDAHNNYIGDISVDWNGTAVVKGHLLPEQGMTTKFTAQEAGTGNIYASHEKLTASPGTIIVRPANVDRVQIESAPEGEGNKVAPHMMKAGDRFQVWAVGYDVHGNCTGNVRVTWSGTGAVDGRLDPTQGVSTTFAAHTVGAGTLKATEVSGCLICATTITVEPALLHRIVIRDGPDGTGGEVTQPAIEAGTTLQVWAAGYDAYDNYIGDVSVTWSGTGVVEGRLDPSAGVSTTLKARAVGTGAIKADDGLGHRCSINDVSVNKGPLHHIMIMNEAQGMGHRVNSHSMNVGDTLRLWAAGYDAGSNYLEDVPVTWDGTGVLLGCLKPTQNATYTDFTAKKAGSGTAEADDRSNHRSSTGIIRTTTPVCRIWRWLEASVGAFLDVIWIALSSIWKFLGGFWGILSLVLVLSTLFLFYERVYLRFEVLLKDIASIWVARPIMILCQFVLYFFAFSMRSDMHRNDHIRVFRERKGRPVSTWALFSFITAILLAFLLASVVSAKDSLIAEQGASGQALQGRLAYGKIWHQLFKSLMTGVLIVGPVFLTLSASLMAVHEYGQRLNREGHLPIYVDTEQLKDKVLEAVREQYELSEAPVVSDLRRLEDGGISLSVLHKTEPTKENGTTVIRERTWLVEADSLGHINKVEEKPLRVRKLEVQS